MKIKTLKELYKQKEEIEEEIREMEKQDDFALYRESILSDCEDIRFLAEAMLHKRQRIKPGVEKLGYKLANLNYKPKEEREETNVLYGRILQKFDVTDYVFNHTHYDECSDGHFFRRS